MISPLYFLLFLSLYTEFWTIIAGFYQPVYLHICTTAFVNRPNFTPCTSGTYLPSLSCLISASSFTSSELSKGGVGPKFVRVAERYVMWFS
jgi:hypothetical protein